MPNDPTHPTDAAPTHPLDQPVSAETGARLLAKMALTEGEALRMIAAGEVSEDQLHEAQNVDLHALSLAITETVVQALLNDSKVELGDHAANFGDLCANVRFVASGDEKMQHLSQTLHASARVDASTVQEVVSKLAGQLRERARMTSSVKETYAPLLAYHHARFPGAKGSHPAPVAVTPAEVKK